ncbi:MAG: hypothetical protein ACRC6V_03275 [Bacteroidales bacterium]
MFTDSTTLVEAFETFRTDAQYRELTPAIPLLFGKENEHITKILVQLGIYKNVKQMRQELSPYERVRSGPLAIFIPENKTMYRDIPSWLFTKSRSYKIIQKMAQVMGICLPDNIKHMLEVATLHDDDKSISDHVRILNYLISKMSEVIEVNFKDDVLINESLLVISALMSLGHGEYKLSRLLNLLMLHPQGNELRDRLMSTSFLEVDQKAQQTPEALYRPYCESRASLDRLLSRVDTAHQLFIDNTNVALDMLNNPRAIMIDLALNGVDHLHSHLNSLDCALKMAEGSELVQEAIAEYGKAIRIGELSVVAKSVRAVVAYEQSIPAFDSHENEIRSLLEQGKYLEISQIAKQVDEARNQCSRAYLDLAEFVQAMTKDLIASGSEIKTSDQRLSEYSAQVSELTHLLEESANEIAHLRERLKNVAKTTVDNDTLGGRPHLDDSAIRLIEGKGSVYDVVQTIAEMFPHVKFLPLAIENAKTSPYTKTDKLFSTLRCLCDEYYKEIISGKPDSEAMKLLSNYRANESEQTMTNKEMAKRRMHKVEGETFCFEQHITLGVRRNATSTIQVFFRIIQNVLYIAYIGEHLDVSST